MDGPLDKCKPLVFCIIMNRAGITLHVNIFLPCFRIFQNIRPSFIQNLLHIPSISLQPLNNSSSISAFFLFWNAIVQESSWLFCCSLIRMKEYVSSWKWNKKSFQTLTEKNDTGARDKCNCKSVSWRIKKGKQRGSLKVRGWTNWFL